MKENYTVDHAFLIGRQVPLACHIPETMRELPVKYILCFYRTGLSGHSAGRRAIRLLRPRLPLPESKQSFRLLSSRDLTAASLIFHPSFLNKKSDG